MKAMNSKQISSFTSWSLKLVGVIVILTFLLDLAILLFPAGPRDTQWQIGLATALVDRGIVPMMGIALILAGYWIEQSLDKDLLNRKAWLDLRFWAFILSSILGLLFLVLFPVHVNNVRAATTERIEQINQKATQAETQLQTQLSQLQTQLGDKQIQAELEQQASQFRTKVTELLKDEKRFNQALQSNQIPESEKKLLQQFKANPKAIDEYVAKQTDTQALANQKLSQIQVDKEQLSQQARQEAWKSSLRTGISSVLLCVGYIAIGWMGLRNIGNLIQSSRSSSVR